MFNADKGKEKAINDSAFRIWKQLDGATPIEMITKDLFRHFEGGSLEEISRDTTAFTKELLDEGFILEANGWLQNVKPKNTQISRIAPEILIFP